ncbi:unnamed protein product [Arctia plantaginis]|uniref:RRM domain-containing protein n=1 Tax=Arctia plantaginis TaxID=874455 RepID=A0A8S1BNK5_ARCPL|nr:unnamed protein product [Arctia plantaginis]
MDYVVGSVAALVSGNVTPSRPRILKRALTPTKHQPSPNVTPKSEFVDDRSIFLSPSVQKKKAMVKKSPKRIFQNPDLETTVTGEESLSLTSPKADKVKKHLKDELDSDIGSNKNAADTKLLKQKEKNKKESVPGTEESTNSVKVQSSNENTPKKKKKKNKTASENSEIPASEVSESTVTEVSANVAKSPKKMKQRRQSVFNDDSNKENAINELETESKMALDNTSPTKQKNNSKNPNSIDESNNVEVSQVANNVNSKKKKNKKRKKKTKQTTVEKTESTEDITVKTDVKNDENNQGNSKKKNRKRKKSKSQLNKAEVMDVDQSTLQNKIDNEDDGDELTVPMKKSKTIVNPNAITDKESDSEHESDDEIESENEEINKKVFAAEPEDEASSDEDEEKTKEVEQKAEKKEIKNKGEVNTEDEVKRTLFVGNVPFSAKCKKEIKKIFNKHGQIETIRIRTVPIKDGRYTPKLAVIKNELHPERTTVNVYIKYADEESAEKALVENNTVLNDHHLRVCRSSSTGAEHDPKCSIFLGNLPFAIEDETLREKFEKCGEIESVRIIRDKKTNAGKGFGYVNFASKDAVELALALTEEDLTIKNRIIRVKRCTQLTNKQKQKPKQDNQRQQSAQKHYQGKQRPQSGQRQHQGNQRVQTGQRQNQGNQRVHPGQSQNQGNQRWNQGFQRGNQGGQRYGNMDEAGQDGAHRRILHKRKSQDANGGDGPPNKRQKDINQPNKEKKTRKEFVGMTAEKKKKRKFDKGQKKKKALSEILTK